ncbi:MAG: hypothetical protein WDO56_07910 [Gammaproteobacteria bacterium]
MSAPARKQQEPLVTRQPVPNADGAAPVGEMQQTLSLARSAGNSGFGDARAQLQAASPALSSAEALKQLGVQARRLETAIATVKSRRNEQLAINEKQSAVAAVSEVAGSVVDALKGKGLHSVDLPGNEIWVEADTLLVRVREKIAEENVVGAAHALQDLGYAYDSAANKVFGYLDSVLGGAEWATTGLEVAAAAGAIAATVLSGGAASALGAGVFGTSVAVGLGAGVYGGLQLTGQQTGEKLAGTREELDFTAIFERAGKDAVMGFVGALAGGALSKWAVNRFGTLVRQRMTPEQVEAVAKLLGVDAATLTAERFVSTAQKFLIDFLGGVATTPLTTAMDAVLGELQGGKRLTAQELGARILQNAIEGGLVQLFLGVLLHGQGGGKAPGRSEQSTRRGSSIEPVAETTTSSVADTPAPLQQSDPTSLVEQSATTELTSTPAATASTSPPTTAEPVPWTATNTPDPPLPVGPDGKPTSHDFSDIRQFLKTVPEGEGPVVGPEARSVEPGHAGARKTAQRLLAGGAGEVGRARKEDVVATTRRRHRVAEGHGSAERDAGEQRDLWR